MNTVTEQDLQDALREQVRRAHADIEAQYAQPGEFSVEFYAQANGWTGSNGHNKAARELDGLEETGVVTKREGIVNGRKGKLYKFIDAP